MFWLDSTMTPRDVPLRWTRTATSDGETTEDTLDIESAAWTLRGNSHYLTYLDDQEIAGQGLRTTLRLEADQFTMIRHGAIRWNHTFREGQHATSTMNIGAMGVPVDATTVELTLEVTAAGGCIRVLYDMELAGDQQRVLLMISFGNEVNLAGQK
jgi:uncharacterized beta-barrel protein YwiB (DUF1934 family)